MESSARPRLSVLPPFVGPGIGGILHGIALLMALLRKEGVTTYEYSTFAWATKKNQHQFFSFVCGVMVYITLTNGLINK